MFRGMWGLLGPGIQPMSPTLAGGFLTTVPPGKSLGGDIDCPLSGSWIDVYREGKTFRQTYRKMDG